MEILFVLNTLYPQLHEDRCICHMYNEYDYANANDVVGNLRLVFFVFYRYFGQTTHFYPSPSLIKHLNNLSQQCNRARLCLITFTSGDFYNNYVSK